MERKPVIGDLARERLKPLHRYRTLFLLLFLLAFILIFPFFEGFHIRDILLVVIITGFLVSAVYNVSEHPREVATTILLLIPAALMSWAHLFNPSRGVLLVQIVSVIAFLIYSLVVTLRRVMTTRHITENEIFSAVSVYIMIGLAFAFTYQFIGLIIPGSFMFGPGGESFTSLMYLSFETLATVGFGDITIIAPLARSVAILEMITGVMYLAIFVGVLVNAHYRLRDESWNDEPGTKGDAWRPGLFRSGGPVSLIIIAVLVNLASALTMTSLNIPLYFDTWGTSLAVLHSGFPAGAIAGILFNLIMALVVRAPIDAIWAASSVLIAAMTWLFWKKGWIALRHPGLILAAGIISGAASALFGIVVTAVLNRPPYAGTLVVSQVIAQFTGNPVLASLTEEFVVQVVDKTLSLFLAVVVAFLIFGTIRSERRN